MMQLRQAPNGNESQMLHRRAQLGLKIAREPQTSCWYVATLVVASFLTQVIARLVVASFLAQVPWVAAGSRKFDQRAQPLIVALFLHGSRQMLRQ